MKLTDTSDRRVMAALRDVARNGGVMWEPKTGREALLLWSELRRRGWAKGSAITDAGRRALATKEVENAQWN